MSTLYIIGNGFDLHHGLHTGTADFINYLKRERVYNECSNAFDVFDSYAVNWNEYEESLSNIDLEEIEKQNIMAPDYMSDHEHDRDGGICNMQEYCDSLTNAVNSALESMVRATETELKRKSERNNKYNLFGEKDAILSFNYTSTVEYLYNSYSIPVFHIHGYFPDNDKLVFGYAHPNSTYENRVNREDVDYYINEQRKEVASFYASWEKQLRIEELTGFLQALTDIDTVEVYGHSMATVDAEYMETIERLINPRVWKVSYHESKDDMEETIKQYTFSKKIKLFEW